MNNSEKIKVCFDDMRDISQALEHLNDSMDPKLIIEIDKATYEKLESLGLSFVGE